MASLLTLKDLKHCSFARVNFRDLQKGDKYMIICHHNRDDSLFLFVEHLYNSKEEGKFFNIRTKRIITLTIWGNWEFLQIIKQKELIQYNMEIRAVNIILKRLLDDSFNYLLL